ncbi:hypothetical protein [Rothia koreensis]|uniref:hypothetical protein n=1 Tax=Rothia koreensis TaxID=592378 RepID=UPI003FCDDE43
MFRKTRNEIDSFVRGLNELSGDLIRTNGRLLKLDELTNKKIDSVDERLEMCWDRIKDAERQQVKARVRANSRDDHKVIPKHHTDTYSRKYYITLECVCGFTYETELHRIEAQAREEAAAATQLHEEGVL